jgi:transposase-like protein
MAKHRTYSIEFKRQVAQEFLAGETLYGLSKRHDICRNLIRVWVQKHQAGAFDDEVETANLLQQYEARIAALERRLAPEHLTRHLLFRIIAYEVQADRLGDLDAETLKVLRQAAELERRPPAVSRALAELDQRRFAPPSGTVLVREWDRKSHRVMVMPDGFVWNGKTFRSLSQVAFAITGTKWNGPRFFGLRDQRPKMNARDSE